MRELAPGTKVLVCGGREFGRLPPHGERQGPYWEEKEREYLFIQATLTSLFPADPETWLPDCTIIEGGATGVDSVAADWAAVNWTGLKEYKADWNKHGKAAGCIRNKQMLEEGIPDIVVAFPGGSGTAHMIKLAQEAGVEVIKIEYIK